jgi:hypothetical protein
MADGPSRASPDLGPVIAQLLFDRKTRVEEKPFTKCRIRHRPTGQTPPESDRLVA